MNEVYKMPEKAGSFLRSGTEGKVSDSKRNHERGSKSGRMPGQGHSAVKNSAPFSWKTRGILTLVREEKPTEYMLLFSARRTLPEAGKKRQILSAGRNVMRFYRSDRGGREDLFRLMMEERPFFSLKVTFDRRNILRSASVNGKPLELFDILKEDGSPAGIVRDRGVAHLDGSLHPTSHIWIVRRNHSSGWDLLLQKRSLFKDSNPRLL